MHRIRKPRRMRRLLPKPRLQSTQIALPSQRKKRLVQKNGDSSSKPDCFQETARSTCCEPLRCWARTTGSFQHRVWCSVLRPAHATHSSDGDSRDLPTTPGANVSEVLPIGHEND